MLKTVTDDEPKRARFKRILGDRENRKEIWRHSRFCEAKVLRRLVFSHLRIRPVTGNGKSNIFAKNTKTIRKAILSCNHWV